MSALDGLTAPRYRVRVYSSEAKNVQSIRIGKDETEFAIGVDFMGVAGDMPSNVVAKVAQALGKVLADHLKQKARGTSRIIVPQVGDITMATAAPGQKQGNGYGLHKG